MKVAEISYRRRNTLGDYQYEELSMVGILEEGDEVQECTAKLKDAVESNLSLTGASLVPSSGVEEITTVKKEPNKEVKKKNTKKKEEPKKEEPKKEEEAPVEKEEESKKEEPKKKDNKTKSKPKSKNVPYDRLEENHQADLKAILKEIDPQWSKDKPKILAAKAISASLNGVEMYDKEGTILDSFKELVETKFNEELEG
jgi:outer membrane biosynthesis protein TonB